MRIRFTLVISGFALIFVALVVNLYRLQIQYGSVYAARAASQVQASGILKPHRGQIFVTDQRAKIDVPVAINRAYPSVFAAPPEIADVPEASQQLSPILGLDPAALAQQLSKTSKYESLATHITDEQAQAVRTLDLAGVYLDSSQQRFYPFNSLAAQVLGFVGPSSKDEELLGRYGIEKQFENSLRGTEGTASGRHPVPAAQGEDVHLTIDRNIQSRAETIIANLMKQFHATGGSVIVQEPKTGKIRAMASVPTFDPNTYGQSSVGTFLNPTTQLVYEPGSIFKVLTMAAGIDSGTFTPDTTVLDTGSLKISGKTIKNWDLDTHGPYGTVTMTNVIEHSINIGAAKAGQLIGREKLLN